MVTPRENPRLEQLIKQINSDPKYKNDYGDKAIDFLNSEIADVETIPTGSIGLDGILGGGLAKGRINVLYGPTGSGKTSIACTAAGHIQRQGGTVLFFDLECAFDPRYASYLGMDTNNLLMAPRDMHAEKVLELIKDVAASGEVDMIILDSVAAMTASAEAEAEAGAHHMALIARLMSQQLKQIAPVLGRTGTTLIILSQVRDNITSYGGGETITGGRALQFYASQVVRITKDFKPVVEKGKPIGTNVNFKVVKNKIAPPYGEATATLTFSLGINHYLELLDQGVKLGLIRQGGGHYTLINDGNEVKLSSSGKLEAVKFIENDPNLQEYLRGNIYNSIKRSLIEGTNIDMNEWVKNQKQYSYMPPGSDDDSTDGGLEDVAENEE